MHRDMLKIQDGVAIVEKLNGNSFHSGKIYICPLFLRANLNNFKFE